MEEQPLYSMKAMIVLLLLAALASGCVHNCPRGEMMSDHRLTAAVRAELKASEVYKFNEVRVLTHQGVTQLAGFVMKETQRREAEELARRVPGARVINNISLAGGMLSEPTGRAMYGPQR